MTAASAEEYAIAYGAISAARKILGDGLPAMRVEFVAGFSDGRWGQYSDEGQMITVKSGLDPNDLQRIVLHEVGHAAQVGVTFARMLPYTLSGQKDVGQRRALALEEPLAERFGRLDPAAVVEIREAMRAHPPVVGTKQADPSWVDAQRATACSYAADVTNNPNLTLSDEARRVMASRAASCATGRSTDSLSVALTERMRAWDAAHPGVATRSVPMLRLRRAHARTAAREMGMSPAAVTQWLAGCSLDRALVAYDGGRGG